MNSIIGVTTLLLVVAMLSVWANRLLFNPDNWSTTSTKLLQNSHVQASTANYLVDQLYGNVDVAGLLRSALPPRLDPLAGPAAGALRNVATTATQRALADPRVQTIWAQANRAAAVTFIAVVNGGKGAVGVNQGAVTLNLGRLLEDVAARLGLPAGLSAKLPPNAANLTIFKAHQLKVVQDVGNAIKGLALWLTIFVPLLYALAIVLARGHHRRTLLTVGWAAIAAGIVVFLLRSVLANAVAQSLTKDAGLRPTITSTVLIATELLATVAGAVTFTGLLLVIAALVAGPARWARSGRRAAAPFLREHALPTYAIAAALLLLLFVWNPIPATGTWAGILTFAFLGLLGTYLLRRQTAHEFPPAAAADTVGPEGQPDRLAHA